MRDDLQKLMEAIARLQDCIRDMGPHAEIAEIRLKPSRDGRYEVERALKASPSYLTYMWPIDCALPANVVCEIMDVKVTVVAVD